MKYALASLVAVGLIGGSQVVASGQESEVEETTGLADHKALDWIVAQARGAKDIGPGHPRYVPLQGANSKGKKLEMESAKQTNNVERPSILQSETPVRPGRMVREAMQ